MMKGSFLYAAMLLIAVLGGAQAFVSPLASSTTQLTHSTKLPAVPSLLDYTQSTQEAVFTSQLPSTQISVETLDPTTFLSDILSGLFGTPAILAIPIVAALGVAGLVVFFIVSYANPAEPDD